MRISVTVHINTDLKFILLKVRVRLLAATAIKILIKQIKKFKICLQILLYVCDAEK